MNVFGIEFGADGDGGHETFVLVEPLLRVTDARGRETVFSGREGGEHELSVRCAPCGCSVVEIADGSDGDFGAVDGSAGNGIDDNAGDAELLLRSGGGWEASEYCGENGEE